MDFTDQVETRMSGLSQCRACRPRWPNNEFSLAQSCIVNTSQKSFSKKLVVFIVFFCNLRFNARLLHLEILSGFAWFAPKSFTAMSSSKLSWTDSFRIQSLPALLCTLHVDQFVNSFPTAPAPLSALASSALLRWKTNIRKCHQTSRDHAKQT